MITGVVTYTITPEEIELIQSGRGSLVPGGEQRGLVVPPFIPRELNPQPQKALSPPVDRSRKSIINTITFEMLVEHLQAGLTNVQIGERYGISKSSVILLLKKFELAGKRGHKRNQANRGRGR